MVVAEKGKEKERRKEVKMRNEELVRDKIGNRKFSLSRRKLQEMEGERERRGGIVVKPLLSSRFHSQNGLISFLLFQEEPATSNDVVLSLDSSFSFSLFYFCNLNLNYFGMSNLSSFVVLIQIKLN